MHYEILKHIITVAIYSKKRRKKKKKAFIFIRLQKRRQIVSIYIMLRFNEKKLSLVIMNNIKHLPSDL